MTREEAAAKIGYIIDCVELGIYCGEDEEVFESLDIALAALRPITREQVEKVWRGCDYCHMKEVLFNDGTLRVEIGHQNIVGGACIDIDQYGGFGIDYCPKCGKPLTNEAVQMVIERLEALKDD